MIEITTQKRVVPVFDKDFSGEPILEKVTTKMLLPLECYEINIWDTSYRTKGKREVLSLEDFVKNNGLCEVVFSVKEDMEDEIKRAFNLDVEYGYKDGFVFLSGILFVKIEFFVFGFGFGVTTDFGKHHWQTFEELKGLIWVHFQNEYRLMYREEFDAEEKERVDTYAKNISLFDKAFYEELR